MKHVAGLMLALLLLAGCTAPKALPGTTPPPEQSRPQAEQISLQGSPVLPPPPDAPTTLRDGGQVLVTGLVVSGRPYLWSPDGSRVAFQDEGGIWALGPEGGEAEPVAAGPGYRELVGWTEEAGLVYLEVRPEGLAVAVGRPGLQPEVVAILTEDKVGAPGRPLWRHLAGSRLVLAAENLPVWIIDLAAGSVQTLTQSPLPVHFGDLAVAPDGRMLAFKLANRDDPVRLLNLDNGTLLAPEDDGSHLPGVAWAPATGTGSAGNLWAVRAAAPGSGLPAAVGANMVEGATRIVVGDAAGGVRRLEPPEPLELVAGPLWSPDGRRLAVTAGVVQGMEPGQPAGFRPTGVWLAEVESGRWQKLGNLPAGWVAGWHPDGTNLLVQLDGTRVERWPVDGGAAPAEPHAWLPGAAAPVPDGGFVYLSPEPAIRVMLERGETEPVPVLGGAGHKSELTVRGGYAAVMVWPDGERPKLALTRLP